MFVYLLLLFTLVPLIELAVLIWLGGETAWWVPILLVIATGLLGAALARWQGWRAVWRIQDDLRNGRMPADAIVDACLVFLAGILLITPGVITDCIGFALLVPPVRAILKRRAADWLRRNIEIRAVNMSAGIWGGGAEQNEPAPRDQIIDAQVIETRVEDAS